MTKVSVIIADDNRMLAAALTDTISSCDDLQLVAVVHDAAGAVEAATKFKPDVVLMDVKMPGGGIAATRAVLAQLPATRVVGLSAHADQKTALEMLEAGAVAYIVKGMPENEIIDAIRRAARAQFSMQADLAVASIRDLLKNFRDRVESEASLHASDERLRAVLDAMPDALLIVGPDGTIEMANSPSLTMFGYAPGELIGQSVEVLVPERSRDAHKKLHASFKEHPRSRAMGSGLQLFGRRKDSAEFPVDISLSQLETVSGVAVVAAIRDMTVFSEADELRRKSEQMFRGLLESAPDAMVVIDQGGRIQVVNARTEDLFGYSRQELLGMSVDELVPESLRAEHSAHRGRYLKSPRARAMGQGLELFGRRRDGTEFPVDISLSPMQTDAGMLVIAAVRDVTDRKLTEQRLAQTQEMAERRRLVAHLVQAQEEERRKIAADIHDDSIQAMTAASLRIQQLSKHITDPQQQGLLDKLDEAVRESIIRLRGLMFDLRPLALDRSGIGAALRELLDRLQTDTGIECTLEERFGTEPSSEVRVELYRIAQEAMANIRKHSQSRAVRLEAQRVDKGFHVRITDDGIGFDVAASSGRAGHLGLIAMRERAEIAGGWWRIESGEGRGTTVEFWLPESLVPA